ncbi:MAG: hypothetical protein KGH95_06450 [Thaumarchaeota archaeon]|nr:hypothetical protein [Nitrososphaerota archaeon]
MVGYFAPEYGDIQPEDKAYQVRQEMLKNHDLIKSGYLMLPMVKFGIFEDGKDMTIDYVEQQLRLVHVRLLAWKNLLTEKDITHHKILVSHTDHDMLSITLGMIFATDIPLEKTKILDTLNNVLYFAQERGLL